jgi:molecular chaperone DnaK (HSP70)
MGDVNLSSILMFCGTVLVVVCAVLAAYGFKGRVTTIGVDLGTTFSVVGFTQNNGEVSIITDKAGHRLFPSVVSYLPDGEIVAAYEATARLSIDPINTIFNSKRFIGRYWDDDQIRVYSENHPFNVIKVNSSITSYGELGFQLSSSATGHTPSQIAPESVGTSILKHLLDVTAEYLGHKQVNKAIIAVPAKFNADQRQATGAAYKAAGLKVIRVLEEPTAAAVAYQLHKKKNIQHILVYDFGGGTLDVSILYVSKGSVQVYATDGDETLGGSDFDLCIYDFLIENLKDKVRKTKNIELVLDSIERNQDSVEKADNACSAPSIRVKAEEVKKALTHAQKTTFSCQLQNETIEMEISRTDFEKTCKSLFDKGMIPVTRLLDELEFERNDIDEIVLVGGTTRIPHVKAMLKEYFGKELNDHIDPDVTVAYGAASVMD